MKVLFALTSAIVILVLLGLFVWRRRKNVAVVDGARVSVRHDSHCTAIVLYRNRDQSVRFGAEVGTGAVRLSVDLPDTMYTDEGILIPSGEYELIKQRVDRGLVQLGITHEFVASSGMRPVT